MSKTEQTTSTTGVSKVVLPSFLDPVSPFYATDFFQAYFYISMILIDHKFVAEETFIKIDELRCPLPRMVLPSPILQTMFG
jgi:hypothetical protein